MPIALPDSPAGRAAAWLLDPGDVDERVVTEKFHPQFLEAIPPPAVLAWLQDVQQQIAGAEVDAVEGSDGYCAARIRAAEGTFTLWCFVEPVEPYRIGQAQFDSAWETSGESVTWDDLISNEPAPSRETTLPADVAGALDDLLLAGRAELRAPGLAAAVVRDGEIVYWLGVGVSGIDPVRPVTPTDTVRIGSISKTLTAIAVLQLVERGLVDLDGPVGDYLTSLRVECAVEDSAPITVRHMLTHTSGIQPQSLPLGIDDSQPVPTLADYYSGVVTAAKEPDSGLVYSNDAFAVLGQLVEDVTGRPFARYMDEEVFDPLGMHASSYVRGVRTTGPMFTGFAVEFGEVAPLSFHEIIVQGAGSVFSSTQDMARLVATLTNDGAPLLQRASFDQMVAKQNDGMDGFDMGLAFVLIDADAHEGPDWLAALRGHGVFWHNGGWGGAELEMWISRTTNTGVLLFANTLSIANAGKLGMLAGRALATAIRT